ncbi:MAG: alpha/beta hydrolase [Ilumatobacter sp.]|nr:alpha/beta hydrolase [bacterium]MDG2039336.1 alpha/beta hydrolase [Ilumatobacter sp.]
MRAESVETELKFKTQGGTNLAATFTVPAGKERAPAVLLCQGLSGIRNLVLPRVAETMAERGIATLRFDYAGYGDSDGPRGWIDPFARVIDGRYALATLIGREEVDPNRIGVYGHSYGGPVAIHIAAQELRARALAVVSSPGGGTDMLRSTRAEWEWLSLVHRLDVERAAIAAGAPPTVVALKEIFPLSPAFASAYAKLKGEGTSAIAAGSGLGTSTFHLASIDRMAVFDPEAAARNLIRCPALFVHGEDDDTAPMSATASIFRAIPGPKQWHSVPGADHNALDTEPVLTSVLAKVGDWFGLHLPSTDEG